MSASPKSSKTVNRGTGAGGAATNTNGLSFEVATDLATEYKTIETTGGYKKIIFNGSDSVFITTKKAKQRVPFLTPSRPKELQAHGCKLPDECYIDQEKKVLFIFEKKSQKGSGSVCEKLQTADFKRKHYSKLFPQYSVVYFYCLSDWFREKCKAELEFLDEIGVRVFWGSDKEYKKKVVEFITGY